MAREYGTAVENQRVAGEGVARVGRHVDVGVVESERCDDGLEWGVRLWLGRGDEHQERPASQDGAGRRAAGTQLRLAHRGRAWDAISIQLPGRALGRWE